MSQFIAVRRALSLAAILLTLLAANAAHAQANLSIVLTVSPTAETDSLGHQTYTAVVTNSGTSSATNLALTFTLPNTDLPIDSSPSSCVFTYNGPLFATCALGTLAPGGNITATAVIYPTAVGNLFVNADASESGGATATAQTGSTLTGVGIADVMVSLTTTPNPAKVGAKLVYGLTAYNIGDDDARDVFVSLQLPPKATYVTASAGCTHTGVLMVCQVGHMAVSGIKTFNITVLPTASGWAFATAGLRESVADPNTLNNSAASRIWVNP